MAGEADTCSPMDIDVAGKKIHIKLFPMFKKFQKHNRWENAQDLDGETLHDFFVSKLDIPEDNIQFERGRKVEEIVESLENLKRSWSSYDIIFFVFLLSLNKEDPVSLNFYDEPMSLYEIFDMVKDIEVPKVFLIQADDENLIPRMDTKGTEPVQTELENWEKTRLPKESLLLMSTFPQQMAQFDSPGEFMDCWKKATNDDIPKKVTRCSLLVKAFIDALEEAKFDSVDLKRLAEKTDLSMMPVLNSFSDHQELKWAKPLCTFRECSLTKPLLL